MMNKRVTIWFAAGLSFLTFAAATIWAEPAADSLQPRPPAIVPRPVAVEKRIGEPFVLEVGAAVKLQGGASPKSRERFLRGILFATGVDLGQAPAGEASPGKAITLRLDPSIGEGRPDWQAAEAYKLTVTEDGNGLEIAASAAHGLFNGTQTLVQLADKGADGKWRVPPVAIEDYPRFRWRGYLLDPARHFRPKAELLRSIDLLALHKLNVFQLHLTDDQGWRIEIKRYPKLLEVGSKLPDCSGETGADRYYSQADIKEIVDYAADRFVLVVPEIEMPGHSGACTTSYPELACEGKPASELCVGQESTFRFMANVLDEVAALFPAPYIHVGADEVQPQRWRACPVCKKRMEELAAAGLPAGVQPFRVKMAKRVGRPFYEDIGRLQSDFIRRIDGYLREKGKRMVGWDEILDGGLASDSQAVIMAWRSPAAVSGALSQERDAVVSLYPECYLDYQIPLARTYAFEPVPVDSPESRKRHVLGVQGNMWGEETKTRQRVDKQTFPRLCALAEVGWTPRESRDFSDFSDRLKRLVERLRTYGIEFQADSAK